MHEPGGAARRDGRARPGVSDGAVRARATIAAGIALLGVTLPQASTPWLESPGSYSAHCTAGGAHVLMVAPRRRAAPTPSPDPTWGLHLTDANIALGNLTDLVGEQAAAFVAGR